MNTNFITPVLVLILVTLNGLDAEAQTDKSANYEAANWDTRFLDSPQHIVLPAPPGAAKSENELQVVRQRVSRLDESKRAEIRYWDAGAPAYRWNQIGPRLISWDKVDVVLRFPMAWMNAAIYDATVLAWREKLRHQRKRPQSSDPSLQPAIIGPSTYAYPCEHSVTASAAANVLVYFFPEKADSILQLARAASQTRIDAGVQYPSDVEAGWKLGEQVAKQIIEKAKNDGSAEVRKFSVNKDPSKWTGTYPLGIALSHFAPMALRSGNQFRPPAPPDFTNEMNEMRNFKKDFRSTSLAYKWANSSYDFWSDIASRKMFEYRMMDDAPAVARIYCLLDVASHDAGIAIMDAKYAYWGIRPNQFDTTFKPLLETPPFPGYPSGHALGASTSATVLQYFFPEDAKQFQQLAQDCADSRFYAGIHFRTDNEVGRTMGRELATYVVDSWMKKPAGAKGKFRKGD